MPRRTSSEFHSVFIPQRTAKSIRGQSCWSVGSEFKTPNLRVMFGKSPLGCVRLQRAVVTVRSHLLRSLRVGTEQSKLLAWRKVLRPVMGSLSGRGRNLLPSHSFFRNTVLGILMRCKEELPKGGRPEEGLCSFSREGQVCAGVRVPGCQAGVEAGPVQAPSVSRSDNGEQTNDWEGRPPRRAGDRTGIADNSRFIQCFSKPLGVQVRCVGILH